MRYEDNKRSARLHKNVLANTPGVSLKGLPYE